jgi:hypothetical protein
LRAQAVSVATSSIIIGRELVSENEDDRPPWHEAQAIDLIGAIVLIGVTHIKPDGDAQEQMFGVVQSADEIKGFEVALLGSRNGQTYRLPPDLRNFFAARPGKYRLRSTGEIVTDPDFTCSWTVYPSSQ